MAKFYKGMCVCFLITGFVFSIATSTYTSINGNVHFNFISFLGYSIVSIFIFSIAWCFGDIAEAARKYLDSGKTTEDAEKQQIPETNSFHTDDSLKAFMRGSAIEKDDTDNKSQVVSEIRTVKCENCGYDNPSFEVNCTNCGKSL